MNRMPKWIDELFIAHRGYFNTSVPENSLMAFQRAIDHGYAIELDVQLLKDGTLIVFHDTQLLRMTGYDFVTSDCDYETIKSLRLKGSDESIPTFEEVLDLVRGQVPLMIEFKNETKSNILEKRSYELLRTYQGAYLVQSFNPLSVLWFKKNAPLILRGQLSCRYEDSKLDGVSKFVIRNVLTNIFTKPDFVIYDIDALDCFVIRWLKFRKKPLYGYTAKSIEDYKKAVSLGIKPVFEGFDPEKL